MNQFASWCSNQGWRNEYWQSSSSGSSQFRIELESVEHWCRDLKGRQRTVHIYKWWILYINAQSFEIRQAREKLHRLRYTHSRCISTFWTSWQSSPLVLIKDGIRLLRHRLVDTRFLTWQGIIVPPTCFWCLSNMPGSRLFQSFPLAAIWNLGGHKSYLQGWLVQQRFVLLESRWLRSQLLMLEGYLSLNLWYDLPKLQRNAQLDDLLQSMYSYFVHMSHRELSLQPRLVSISLLRHDVRRTSLRPSLCFIVPLGNFQSSSSPDALSLTNRYSVRSRHLSRLFSLASVSELTDLFKPATLAASSSPAAKSEPRPSSATNCSIMLPVVPHLSPTRTSSFHPSLL